MNSENTKKVDFLKFDVNQNEYQLVKSGKSIYNLPKHQIYNQHHSTIHDFTLNPKNTYSDYPFNGSSFYIDFELPKLNYCYHQFVLRYKLASNDSVNSYYYLPHPLIIERLVLLKNSNVFCEVNNEDILLFNLHKVSTKYDTSYSDFDYQCSTGLRYDTNNKFSSPYFDKLYANVYDVVNMELPLPLTNSHFLSNAIKNDLTVRIYFRGNIITSNVGSNSNIKIADLKLMLRMKEVSHSLVKEPKFNHLFTKKILTKINIPKLDENTVYNLNISGFNSVASFALIYIKEQDSNINFASYGAFHKYNYSLDEVSIQDNTGKNILYSDIVLQKDYNRYLMSENFKQFAHVLHKLCPNFNDGHLMLLPFSYDGHLSYNSGFSGGMHFNSSNDYKIKFKSLNSSNNRSVILNILFFSPSMLQLESGELNEFLSN